MKIKEHGDPKRINCEDYILQCRCCGCVFTFSSHEYEINIFGGTGKINCPECKNEIRFNPLDEKNWYEEEKPDNE